MAVSVLGLPRRWLQPALMQMSEEAVFIGAAALKSSIWRQAIGLARLLSQLLG
jgi:hypothetical protein